MPYESIYNHLQRNICRVYLLMHGRERTDGINANLGLCSNINLPICEE